MCYLYSYYLRSARLKKYTILQWFIDPHPTPKTHTHTHTHTHLSEMNDHVVLMRVN